MNLQYGSEAREAFVTNVGLISSNGFHGHDVMAAEWTMQISYDPGLIMVSIGPGKATSENIAETGVFGVSIAADHQNVLSSVSGGSQGKQTNKLPMLQEMGFTFTKAKDIDVYLVDESMLRMECNVIDERTYGDHIIFVGEASNIECENDRNPLIYHSGKYVGVGADIAKPNEQEREQMKALMETFKK